MINSRQNTRLKTLRRLRRDRGFREERGEGLIEGPHLLDSALSAGLTLTGVYASPDWLEQVPDLLARLPSPPTVVERSLLEDLADADSPRGVVASAVLPSSTLSAWNETAPRFGPIVAVDRLQDPGNLGALARVAEAAGASLLLLSPGTVDWRHPRALRASTGSLLRIPVVDHADLEDARRELSQLEAGLGGDSSTWIGLSPRSGVELWSSDALPRERTVLVVGSESGGLSVAARAAIDHAVTIPMAPPVESLNATAAAAVVLFELARRRGRDGGR